MSALSLIRSIRRDERGATAIEYGLIAAILAVVIVGGFTLVGGGLEGALAYINETLSAAN